MEYVKEILPTVFLPSSCSAHGHRGIWEVSQERKQSQMVFWKKCFVEHNTLKNVCTVFLILR